MEILVTIPDTLTEHLQPEEPTASISCNGCCSKKPSRPCIAPARSRRCRRWPGWSWRIVRTFIPFSMPITFR